MTRTLLVGYTALGYFLGIGASDDSFAAGASKGLTPTMRTMGYVPG